MSHSPHLRASPRQAHTCFEPLASCPDSVDALVGPPGGWHRQRLTLDRTAQPLVSALMVTRGRGHLARTAVQGWLAQTWPSRELVIVEQGEDAAFGEWIARLGDARIRHVTVPEGSMVLGDQRNESLRLARGEYVAVWDDDDLHHPLRLEMQVLAAHSARAASCLLARTVAWWPAMRFVWAMRLRPNEGTMLWRRDLALAYPPLLRAEDTDLRNKLLQHHSTVVVDQPWLYIYRIHGRNTWDTPHFNFLVSESSAELHRASYTAFVSRMAQRVEAADDPLIQEAIAAIGTTDAPASAPQALGLRWRRWKARRKDRRTLADLAGWFPEP